MNSKTNATDDIVDICKGSKAVVFINHFKSEGIKISDDGNMASFTHDEDRFGLVYINKIFEKNKPIGPDFCNYIEFKLDADNCNTVCIGFADPINHKNERNGILGTEHSYSYCIQEGKRLHNLTKDDEDEYDLNGSGAIEGWPQWRENDVIGCGIDMNTWEIFYTRNGGYIGVGFKPTHDYLQVACTLSDSKEEFTKIIDGISQPFVYNGPEVMGSKQKESHLGFSTNMKFKDFIISENGYLATINRNDKVEFSVSRIEEDHVVLYLNATFRSNIAKKEEAQGKCNYFELTIIKMSDALIEIPGVEGIPPQPECGIGVGFADASKYSFSAVDRMIGWDEGSYGYHSDDGGLQSGKTSGSSADFVLETYTEGDTVGFGLNTETWEIFYTKNGNFLGYHCKVEEEVIKPAICFFFYIQNYTCQFQLNDGMKEFLYSGPEVKNANISELLKSAKKGTKAWNRTKIMIVGEGRAGKTALANSIIGHSFRETESTVGINQFTCDVKYAGIGGGLWAEYQKPEKELEAALARLVIEARNDKLNNIDRTNTTSFDDNKNVISNNNKIPIRPSNNDPSFNNDKPVVTARKTVEVQDGNNNTKSSALTIAKIKAEDIDNELVMKCLADSIQTESKLIMSLFDYGGQSVFNVIHHFFLTRYGVYLIVFNMEWLVSSDPNIRNKGMSYLSFWLNSVVVHTWNNVTLETAPIIFVGTRRDIISDPNLHVQISSLLYDTFKANMAWPFILDHENGIGPNGRINLFFFPVDNKLGRDDVNLKCLLSVIEKKLLDSSYVHEEKPLSWLQAFDKLLGEKNSFIDYRQAESLSNDCGIPPDEVPHFLRFLHEMGYLMWHEEKELRDIVIIDAVSFFVTPVTAIICKHIPTGDDKTHHSSEIQKKCNKSLPQDWLVMTSKGLVSDKLFAMLLSNYKDHIHILKKLMIKFGLLVPLLAESDGIYETNVFTGVELSNLSSARAIPGLGNINHKDNIDSFTYLVPALLPECNRHNNNWSDESYSTCFFVVTSANLHQYSSLTMDDLKSLGFLPRGLFERLVGKVVAWCQQSVLHRNLNDQDLYQDEVILSFSSQRFRLKVCQDINCIQLDIEGKNPLLVHEFIESQISKIIAECMKSLKFFSSLPFLTNNNDEEKKSNTNIDLFLRQDALFLPLHEIYNVVKNQSILQRKGGRKLLTAKDAFLLYGAWIPDRSLRENYDFFISYRWGRYDSLFVRKLFGFSNYNVGEENRAVNVFLDKERLQDGRQFQIDFAKALFVSIVIVPILSYDSLERMLNHDPSKEDNLLIEWLLALQFYESDKSHVSRIFPVVFGKRTGEIGEIISNLFTDSICENLPKIVPTATLKVSYEYMRSLGVEATANFYNLTIYDIIQQIKKFQCFPTWISRNSHALLEIECSKQIEKVLKRIPISTILTNDNNNNNDSPNKTTNNNIPSVFPGFSRTLQQLIDDIKSQFGIEDTNVLAVLKQASENLLDAESMMNYNKLKILDKARYLADVLGLPI